MALPDAGKRLGDVTRKWESALNNGQEMPEENYTWAPCERAQTPPASPVSSDCSSHWTDESMQTNIVPSIVNFTPPPSQRLWADEMEEDETWTTPRRPSRKRTQESESDTSQSFTENRFVNLDESSSSSD